MDISRINNYQSVLADMLPSRVSKGKTTGASGGDPLPPVQAGNVASAGGPDPQTLSSIDFIKKSLDDILVNFPPWFPPGAPQRMDLINKMRNIQEQMGKSPVQDETVKHLADRKLSDAASDKEISAVMDGFRGLAEALTQKNVSVSGRGNSGALVNLKV